MARYNLRRDWELNKEGILGGAVAGIVVATYLKLNNISMADAINSAKGSLFDRAVNVAPATKETIILYAMSILVFATIGYFVDRLIVPNR